MQSDADPFHVRVEFLDGPTPSEAVLRADERTLLERAQAVLEHARIQAQTLLQEAREEAARIRTEAAHLGETEKEALRRQTRDESVQQGLQWLVEEARLEAALVDRVEARVRDMLRFVLQQWIDDQDRLAQLTHWLAAQVRDRAQPAPYRIRLQPNEHDALVKQLTQRGSAEGIDYIADASLVEGQAVIDTEFLRIEFDLARHWKHVLAALKRSPASKPD